jgi:uncharacterized membrane protein YbhN (UPF0104 family)
VVKWALEILARFVPRLRSGITTPNTKDLWRSLAWTLVPVLASSAAFALLLLGPNSLTALLSTMGAFSAAWLVGFLAFPFPSGLGARELVLIGLLPTFEASLILTMSVAQRVAGLIAEAILLLAVSKSAFLGDPDQ